MGLGAREKVSESDPILPPYSVRSVCSPVKESISAWVAAADSWCRFSPKTRRKGEDNCMVSIFKLCRCGSSESVRQ